MAQFSRRAAACTRTQEIREPPSTSEQEQGQGKHVGAVGNDDEVEDGWLLLEKKAGEKSGGRNNGNHSHTGFAAATAEPCLPCRRWWGDLWSVDWPGGRGGSYFPTVCSSSDQEAEQQERSGRRMCWSCRSGEQELRLFTQRHPLR